MLLETAVPPLSKGLDDRPLTPLFQGLDPALEVICALRF